MTQLPWPRLVVAHRSDPGRDPNKQVNEDACVYQETPLGHLLVVCDGMGGHAGGREASNLAIGTILAELARAPAGAHPGEVLRQAIKAANRQVWALGGRSEGQGRPGSTCVAVLVHPLGTEVAHIGDSRVYLVRAGQIWQLTRDHSMVQQMVDAGMLRREDMAGHPDSNKITRALGMDPEADVELRHDVLVQQSGDLFLLCSDGVSDVVRDSDLLAVATLSLDGARVPQLCDQIVQLANARGGPDNITVVAGLIVDPGLRAGAGAPRPGATRTVPEGETEPSPPVMLPADLAPNTTRLNRPHATVPSAEPPPPSPPPAQAPQPAQPAPSGQPEGARRRPGAGKTVPLSVHAAGGAQVSLRGSTGSRQATIVDDGTVDADAPSVRPAPRPSRGLRVALGAALFFAGALLAGLSLRSLLFDDEAPPPLTETPQAPAASASAASSR